MALNNISKEDAIQYILQKYSDDLKLNTKDIDLSVKNFKKVNIKNKK